MMKRFPGSRPLWRKMKSRVRGGAARHQVLVSGVCRFARFWAMAWKSFSRNRGMVRAAALTYSTLLALIPMLAVGLGITSSFLKAEGEQQIDTFISRLVVSVMPRSVLRNNFVGAFAGLRPPGPNGSTGGPSPPAMTAAGKGQKSSAASQRQTAINARKELARRIHQFIQNTRSGALGVAGSVGLIVTAILLLSQIESVFNDIWGVAHGRSWFAQIVLYWAVISLAPLLLALALGLVGGPYLSVSRRLLATLPFFGNILFHILPVLVLCLVFAVFYALIPHTKVHWRAALIGGAVGGVLWYLNNLMSVAYVSQVVSNSRIYGSLGLVPVFMLGLYLSWLILLFGAQVSYAFQNRSAYTEEEQKEILDERSRELVALRLMGEVGGRFLQGYSPASLTQLSHKMRVPTRLVQELMGTLRQAHLVSETAGREPAYLPALPPDKMTCYDVLQAVRTDHGRHLAVRHQGREDRINDEFRRFEAAERQAAASVSIRMLAEGNGAAASGNRSPAAKMEPAQLPRQARPHNGEDEMAA